MYRWKNTVGPVEQRKAQRNIWNYHQTAGLGYFEYFQFCEDIGAIPLPVVPAGVCCQNSADGGQNGIPMCDMDDYVQEVLDLIEYANGDSATKWGKVRAEAGHPAAFNLKYIGIGNEDLISDVFEERFSMIYKAVQEKHPEIIVIGTAGPFYKGTDYEEGWAIADKLKVPMIDEHYYNAPGWFVSNQNFYDSYPRSGSKVYLGEYASGGNALYNALAEAAYMTSLERNGDIVDMASYAPLLAKENHTQWATDLIFFNNQEVKPTPNYYVQQLFGQNAGDEYVSSSIQFKNPIEAIEKRVVSSVVKDWKTGDIIIKLVNILPSKVIANIRFDGNIDIDSNASKSVVFGKLEDKIVHKESSTIGVDKAFKCDLPANSLSIIRLRHKS
jgi:alpha-L-arabinofuranosidase